MTELVPDLRPKRKARCTVKVLTCPTRARANPQPAVDDDYGRYYGGGWTWAKCDYAANGFLVRHRPRCSSFSAVADGLSETILLGEKSLSPLNYNTGTWFYDEPYFLGGSFGNRRIGALVVRDEPGCPFWDNWGSAHAAGCAFAFADASVRLLPFASPQGVVRDHLSPAGVLGDDAGP